MMNRREALSLAAAVTLAPALPALAQDTPMVPDIVMGDPDAPVTLIEYASFTCPHCARFHDEVLPAIKEEYVDTGRVRFVYREVFFDRPGLWAAMLARCAGEDRYMAIADLLYARQAEWTRAEPAQIAQNLMRIGLSAGMSQETIDACFSDGEMAQAMVQNYETKARADDIRSTPSFVLQGERLSNMSLADLRERIDEALADAG